MEKKTGVVKFFNSKKGYGFIKTEEGKDIFVHYTGIVAENDEEQTLNQYDRVEFEVVQGQKGPQAQNVKVVEKTDGKLDLYSSGKGFRI